MQLTVLLILALSQAAYAAPNLVKDHRFGELGAAITDNTAQNVNWNVEALNGDPVTLTTGDVVRRSHGNYIDKYDVYLEAGQMLSQDIFGLTIGQKYQMRIRVLANPDCNGNEKIEFGPDPETTYAQRADIYSEAGGFSTDVKHSMTFVATKAVTIQVLSLVSEGSTSDCKGPRIREVELTLA
jgi:hypothetical protein